MFNSVISSTIFGLEAFLVEIEIDTCGGLPSYILVGLPDAAVKESKERINSAIRNSGFQIPIRKITINLAPADLYKKGTYFDLPIAVGILASSSQIGDKRLKQTALIGELALDGRVRKVNGVLPMGIKLFESGIRRILVPKENAKEAALVSGLTVIPVDDLKTACQYLNGDLEIPPYRVDMSALFAEEPSSDCDFADIKGQLQGKRALEICAAGGHNVLMFGSPGAGKTMLARSLPGILPSLTSDEALEITKLYSIAGLLPADKSLITMRVFRAPHHTISQIGLIGGGSIPKPGEVSLANLGILFLDEIPEFQRTALEVLRQPLEDGHVTISRSLTSVTFPARFTLVAAMNPCPCGNHLDPARECSCTPFQVQRYWSKLSGPLLDRVDLHLEVPRLKEEELLQLPGGEPSSKVRERVTQAREIQSERFYAEKTRINAHMNSAQLKRYCQLDDHALALLRQANRHYGFSARGIDRLIKVARTIADLQKADNINNDHLAEALQYRVGQLKP